MTRLSIIHKTAYKYNKRVTLSYNEARMTPLTDPQQVVLESSLKVSPSQAALSSYRDYWGTRVTAFDMQMPHEHLEVLSTTTVEVHRVERIPAEADIVGWDVLEAPETLNKFSDWIPQSQLTGPGAEVLGIIPGVVEGRNPHEAAMAVFEWMRGEMTYMKGSTGVTTNAEQAWNQRQGVCQDLAHLAIGALRSRGIPARYVSGYLHPRSTADLGETVAGTVARLAGMVGRRMAQLGPHQPQTGRRLPRDRGTRPGLPRRAPAQGDPVRRRRLRPQRERGDHPPGLSPGASRRCAITLVF